MTQVQNVLVLHEFQQDGGAEEVTFKGFAAWALSPELPLFSTTMPVVWEQEEFVSTPNYRVRHTGCKYYAKWDPLK